MSDKGLTRAPLSRQIRVESYRAESDRRVIDLRSVRFLEGIQSKRERDGVSGRRSGLRKDNIDRVVGEGFRGGEGVRKG